jgi:hypothetical protein
MQSTKLDLFPYQIPVLEALSLPKGFAALYHQRKRQASREPNEGCRDEAVLSPCVL